MSEQKTVIVSWYICDCPWVTKVCEDHKRIAEVPEKVLMPWLIGGKA